MKKQIILATSIFSFILTSCATKYQPSSFFSGGYSEIRTTSDTFLVSFNGNGFTSKQRALRFALLRASELAVQNNYHYFSILSTIDDTKSSMHAHTYNRASGSKEASNYSSNSSSSTDFYTVDQPCINLTIKCYKDKPENIEVIDAHEYFTYNSHN